MPLSRLENFLKNVDGNILYVNPSDLDSTDAIENQGNSQTRPFKTIQRALLESARFSYNIGPGNDRFDKTSIMLMPGTYNIDNRPGYSVINSGGSPSYRNINGEVVTLPELTNLNNYDIEDPENDLYKFNSTEGGVIVPRGTSIVGLDLRKTKIRPKYVPDPTNAGITSTAIFRVTGGCYFWQFSFFDGDLNNTVYYNNTPDVRTPNFSHHKLTCFEYADGINGVGIGTSSGLTDLQMYYYKISKAYGNSSGRQIDDFPPNTDIEPLPPEFKIVGAVSANDIGITSASAISANPLTATVITQGAHGLSKDDTVRISGFTSTVYNGSWAVIGVTSERQFDVNIGAIPATAGVLLTGLEKLVIEPDNVNGASPYIFNCTLRSTYGMNGLYANGSKSSGFKSIIVAQFTGISLQRDDNAFVIYNKNTGTYQTNETSISAGISSVPLHLNSQAIYRPEYESYHVRASNGGFIQAVSIFSIGFSQHFLAESGGDMSITNSNSNFGGRSLVAKGFQENSFDRDDVGCITHIIPPKDDATDPDTKTWVSLNVGLTTSASGGPFSNRIYLYGSSSIDNPPPHIIDSFAIGSKVDEVLYVNVSTATSEVTLSAPVLMPIPAGTDGPTSEKSFKVIRVGAANSITSNNTFNLEVPHSFFTGESVRILSDNGNMPDGVLPDNIYYAITGGSLSSSQLQISRSLNDAISGTPIPIDIFNGTGGLLKIVSRVNDKRPNDIGHPIQFDTTNLNWYINTSTSASKNTVVSGFNSYRQFLITNESSKSYIKRKIDTRTTNDRIYRLRYVIPKEFSVAREPSLNYIIQETKTSGVNNSSEFSVLTNQIQSRAVRILSNIVYNSSVGICTVTTEKPHNFILGDVIKLSNVRSSDNPVGYAYSGYNGIHKITKLNDSKNFEFAITGSIGSYVDTSSNRDQTLPTISRQEYKNTLYIYNIEKLQEHSYNKSDGIYHLTCLSSNISPSDSFFSGQKYSQSPSNLYPTIDKDNYNSDPNSTLSYAQNEILGKVNVNDRRNSITKQTVETFLKNNCVGIAITNATNSSGTTTIYTNVEHNLNAAKSLSLVSFGTNYGYTGISTVLYNARLVGVGITGDGATANIAVSAAGTVTGITLVDGGSAYGIGMTMTVVGVKTQASWSPAVVSVTSIINNVGDAIEVVGVGTTGNRTNSNYNGLYRILGISSSRSLSYDNGSNPGIYTGTTGSNGFFRLVDEVVTASAISYTNESTGIVTVTTSQPHGLIIGNKFTIAGAAQTVYNGTFIVKNRINTTNFDFYIGPGFNSAVFTGSCFIIPNGLTSRGGDTSLVDERVGSRMIPLYAGISTTAAAGITTTATSITLNSILGFSTGDYLQIDNEVLRISGSVNLSANTANVLRGTLGTRAALHDSGSVVRKIRVIPTELRRHSILRASGQTFEYVGFGHGNYAAALPSRQNRILTREQQLLTQSVQENGGTVSYTGTNDSGDFYIGNKIISPINGSEVSINLPRETFLGVNDSSLSVTYDDVTINNSLKVTGGIGNFQSSEFRGPVSLYRKLTSTSSDGIQAIKLELKGTATQVRSYSVGIATPVNAVTQGDVIYTTTPSVGGYLGWVYTGSGVNDGWKRFGLVSQQANSTVITPDKIGINSTAPRDLLDIRNGGAILDQLRVTGIVTFDNGGSVNRITLGDVNVIGFTTFASTGGIQVACGASFAGITTFKAAASFSGITTFSNNVSISTNTTLSVDSTSVFRGDTSFGNISVQSINVLTPNGFTGTAPQSKKIATVGISTNNNHYLTFVSNGGTVTTGDGAQDLYTNTGIYYNPSTFNFGSSGSITAGTSLNSATGAFSGNVTISNPGTLLFGSTTRQMLNLYSTSYGLGVQSSTLYFRSGSRFSWYQGGIHSDLENTPGSGGTLGMTLDASSNLLVTGSVSGTSFTSSVATGTAPLTVSSTTKLTNLNADYLDGYTSDSANTASTIVLRDGSGNFSAGTITASLTGNVTGNVTGSSGSCTGNAATATTLQTARTINGVSFNGGSNITITSASPSSLSAGSYLTGTAYDGSTAVTWAVDATPNNTASKVVARDSSGNFSAGTITASLTGNVTGTVSGNAGSATVLQTTRNINGVGFNGSAAITITASNPFSLVRGSYLTGSNYDGSSAVTWAVDATSANTGDKIVLRDGSGNFSAGTITATFSGNLGGNVTGNVTGNLTGNVTGNLTGNVTGNVTGSSGSCTGNAATSSATYVNGSGDTGSWYVALVSSTGNSTVTLDSGLTYNASTNALSVTGDITAFASDIRLKTNIRPIENALSKVCSLSGFTYNFNGIAANLGLLSEDRIAGVSAQEVLKVLPEAVKPAPVNSEYLTVQYEKLIPLLIEAIKELQEKVKTLESKAQ